LILDFGFRISDFRFWKTVERRSSFSNSTLNFQNPKSKIQNPRTEDTVIPKEFDYVAPGSLAEALDALQRGGDDAKVLAGGHSLIPMLKLRLAQPSLLVDLRKIGELQRIGGNGSGLELGPMVTYYNLQTTHDVSSSYPLLAEVADSIGDAQVRARGTIGGSLAHADPAADMPAAALALNAMLTVAKAGGSTREIAANDFFVDLMTSALEPGEILTKITIPKPSGRMGSAYVKIRNKASHYALVGAAVVLGLDGDGTCNSASVAITGAASKAFHVEAAENALRGTKLADGDIDNAVGQVGGQDVEWMSDLFGSEDYRKHLTGVVVRRAIQAAKLRA